MEQRIPSWATCKRTRKWRISCYPNLRGYSKHRLKNSRKSVSLHCSTWIISVTIISLHWPDCRNCKIPTVPGHGIKEWTAAVMSRPILPNWMPALLCWPVRSWTDQHLLYRKRRWLIFTNQLWKNTKIFLKHRKKEWSSQECRALSCNICILSLFPADRFLLPIKLRMLIIFLKWKSCFRQLQWIRRRLLLSCSIKPDKRKKRRNLLLLWKNIWQRRTNRGCSSLSTRILMRGEEWGCRLM